MQKIITKKSSKLIFLKFRKFFCLNKNNNKVQNTIITAPDLIYENLNKLTFSVFPIKFPIRFIINSDESAPTDIMRSNQEKKITKLKNFS